MYARGVLVTFLQCKVKPKWNSCICRPSLQLHSDRVEASFQVPHTHTKLARSCHCTLQLSNTLMYFICLRFSYPLLFSLFLSAFIIWKNKATTASHVCEWGESRKQLQLIKVSGQQLPVPLPPDLLVPISISLSFYLPLCLSLLQWVRLSLLSVQQISAKKKRICTFNWVATLKAATLLSSKTFAWHDNR